MTVVPIAQFSTVTAPVLPTTFLTEEEQQLIMRLQMQSISERYEMLRAERYYLGNTRAKNLRIAVPAELEDVLDIVSGWPELAVDPYVERIAIDGFRFPNQTDADDDLTEIAVENGLAAKVPMAVTDALMLGRSLWMIGSNPEPGGVPIATVESPLNLLVDWDLNGREAKTGFQQFWQDGRWHATLLVRGMTTTMAVNDQGVWEIVDRDKHGFDFVPIVRMAHKPRTNNRSGQSAITRAIRSVVQSACRDLFGLEVARELFSVPGITLLGAAESDFMNSDGTAKTAWETYITKVRALERDAEGNTPEIHQMKVYDPATFTKIFEMRASQMASMVAAPPQDLGLYSQGNPVSADASDAMEARRNRRARRIEADCGDPMADVMRMLVRFLNKGVLPPEMRRLETDWVPIDDVSFTTVADAVSKLTAGVDPVLPPRSDVTLSLLGLTALQRRRVNQDRGPVPVPLPAAAPKTSPSGAGEPTPQEGTP